MKRVKKHEKIKILYIITGLDKGGAENLLLSILRKLNRDIFTPIVLCLYTNTDYLKAFKMTGTKIYCLEYANKYNIFIVRRIMQIIRIEKPTIVHTHLPHATIWGRIASCLSGIKILFTTEHNISIWKKKYIFFFVLYKLTYRLDKKIITVSKAVKKMMIAEFGIPPQKIEVIYNGIDLKEISNVTTYPEDLKHLSHPIIGTVGRLHRTKGHVYIIESFKTIIKHFPKANLLIVGDGVQREHLQELIKGHNLDHAVHLLGTRNDIIAILNTLDIFVFPSMEEGLGIALIEACAAGKPCVATNIGGIPEVVEDGVNGFLVPPANDDAITNRIIELLENKRLCRSMGQCGRKIVREKFNIIDKVHKLEKLYLQSVRI